MNRLVIRNSAWLFLLLLALCSILPSCHSPAQVFTIAAHPWIGYEPMFLAHREGWIDHQQVALMETKNATASMQALRDNKVIAAALTLDEAMMLRRESIDIQVVMIFDESAGADAIVAKTSFDRMDKLKGRRIAMEHSTVGGLFLEELLKRSGLNAADVQIVNISADQHLHAWQNNEVDAIISYEPHVSKILDDSGVRLEDSRSMPGLILDVLVVKADSMEQFSGALATTIAGHNQALDHIRTRREDAAYRMSNHLGLPAEEVLAALRHTDFLSVEKQRSYLQDGGDLQRTARRISTILSLDAAESQRVINNLSRSDLVL